MLRCFVINGKVVTSIQREAALAGFRANIHQDGSASVVNITVEELMMISLIEKKLGWKQALPAALK